MNRLNAIAERNGLAIAVGDDSLIWHIDQRCGPERITAPPRPAGCTLRAVAIRHGTDAWAVGDAGAVLRWNGSAWSRVQAGLFADRPLQAICLTDTDAWIGGRGALWRWPLGSAQPVPVDICADMTVHALHATGPRSVACLCARRLLFRFDGTDWSVQALPGEAEHQLYALGGPPKAPLELWAAGTEGALLRFDRGAWRSIARSEAERRPSMAKETIDQTTDTLAALCSPAPGQVYLATEQGALLHWDHGLLRLLGVSPLGALLGVCTLGRSVLAAGDGGLLRWEPPAPDDELGLRRLVCTLAGSGEVRRWLADDRREADREVLLEGRERGRQEGREQGALAVLHRIYVERFGRGPDWWPAGLGARELPEEVAPIFLRCTQEEIARAALDAGPSAARTTQGPVGHA